jgi:hypothetical protein
MTNETRLERLSSISDRLTEVSCGLRGLGTILVHAPDNFSDLVGSELGSAVSALGQFNLALTEELHEICRELERGRADGGQYIHLAQEASA